MGDRRRGRMGAVTAAGLAGLALGGQAVAQGAPALLNADTGGIQVRPATVDFVDRARIDGMRWTIWSAAVARGRGNAGAVRVVLSHPRRCGGRVLFTRTVAVALPGRPTIDGQRRLVSGGRGCAMTLGSTSRVLADFASGDRGPRHFSLAAETGAPATVRGSYRRVVWTGWTGAVARGRAVRAGVPVALVARVVRSCEGIHHSWTLAYSRLTITERPGTPRARSRAVDLC